MATYSRKANRMQQRFITRLTSEQLLEFQYCKRLIAQGYSEGVAIASTRKELQYNPALL